MLKYGSVQSNKLNTPIQDSNYNISIISRSYSKKVIVPDKSTFPPYCLNFSQNHKTYKICYLY
ncbi:MAG: hypothetical protein M3P17_03420, partial [Thermoproteota archaeon]|nr:hypothetical protein [Thermoproteota archaeon]